MRETLTAEKGSQVIDVLWALGIVSALTLSLTLTLTLSLTRILNTELSELEAIAQFLAIIQAEDALSESDLAILVSRLIMGDL